MSAPASTFAPVFTSRLELRCPMSTDAESISVAMTPAISQWVASWSSPFTVRMASDRILRAQAAAELRTAISFVIAIRATGEFLGWIGASKDHPSSRRAMIGYWLAESGHGKGYMREAIPAALAAAFAFLNVDVIEAGVQPGNGSSIAILKGCGMDHVGERMIFAPARNREEACLMFELERPEAISGAHA